MKTINAIDLQTQYCDPFDKPDERPIPTGFPGLDAVLGGGLLPCSLYIVKANNGRDTTDLGLQISSYTSLRRNTCIVSPGRSLREIIRIITYRPIEPGQPSFGNHLTSATESLSGPNYSEPRDQWLPDEVSGSLPAMHAGTDTVRKAVAQLREGSSNPVVLVDSLLTLRTEGTASFDQFAYSTAAELRRISRDEGATIILLSPGGVDLGPAEDNADVVLSLDSGKPVNGDEHIRRVELEVRTFLHGEPDAIIPLIHEVDRHLFREPCPTPRSPRD